MSKSLNLNLNSRELRELSDVLDILDEHRLQVSGQVFVEDIGTMHIEYDGLECRNYATAIEVDK